MAFIFTVVCCYHITYTFQSDSILAGADLEYMVTNFCKIHTIMLQLLLLFLLLLLLLLLSLLSLLLKWLSKNTMSFHIALQAIKSLSWYQHLFVFTWGGEPDHKGSNPLGMTREKQKKPLQQKNIHQFITKETLLPLLLNQPCKS